MKLEVWYFKRLFVFDMSKRVWFTNCSYCNKVISSKRLPMLYDSKGKQLGTGLTCKRCLTRYFLLMIKHWRYALHSSPAKYYKRVANIRYVTGYDRAYEIVNQSSD